MGPVAKAWPRLKQSHTVKGHADTKTKRNKMFGLGASNCGVDETVSLTIGRETTRFFRNSCGVYGTSVDDEMPDRETVTTLIADTAVQMPKCVVVFVFTLILQLGATAFSLAEDRASRLKQLINEHQLKAEALGAEASKRKAPFAGTANNEFGLASFRCAALAYLFGKDDIFSRIGEIEETKLTSSMDENDLLGLSLNARLHDNWALAADSVLQQGERNRIEIWNLNCVSQYEIGEQHYLARIAPNAEFELRGDQLHILGDIDIGFYDRFHRFLTNSPQVKIIVLGSGGGSVRDAIRTAMLIRKQQLDTTLIADCYSACPLIFLGGVNRQIWSPYPRLGFHQVSVERKAVPSEDEIYTAIRQFAERMGANGAFLLKLILASSPDDMNYPPVWDLCEPRITTWVQRGCT